jgi:hypothetical protein
VRPIEAAPAPFDIPERRTPTGEDAARPTATTEPVSPGRYRIELSSPPAPAPLKSTGTTLARGRWELSEIAEDDPNSGVWTHRASSSWTRGGWECAVEASCELRSTAADFQLSESLVARRGDKVVFERWARSRIKRKLV